MAYGALNTATLVTTSNPLPVDIRAGNATVTVDNGGTFVVQEDGAALTALQLIDDVIFVDDTATHTAATTKLAGIGAVATPTDAAVDANDIGMLAMSLDRRLHVDSQIVGTDAALDVSGATVTVDNGGTFVVQVDGAALTSLQLIDDTVYVDDADWVDNTSKHLLVGGVYQSTPQTITDGDVGPIEVDSTGRLRVVVEANVSHAVTNSGTFAVQVDGDALTALQLIDNPVAVLGTATYTETTTSGMIVGAVRNDTLAALADTDNEIAPLQVNDSGALYIQEGSALDVSAATVTVDLAGNNDVTIDGSSIVLAEDDAHSTGDAGIQMLAVRKATPADLSNADGDYEPLQLDNGRLWTSTLVTDIVPGVAAASLGKAEDAVHGSGDTGVMALVVRNDALAALAAGDGDYVPLQVGEDGGLWTRPAAGPKGGCKMFTSVDLDESEEDPAAGPVTIYGIYVWNLTAAPLWLQLFNTNTVTVGTTAPTNNFMIPANADSDGAGVAMPIPVSGMAYDTALTVAITTGSGTNNGAPGAGDAGIAIWYQD